MSARLRPLLSTALLGLGLLGVSGCAPWRHPWEPPPVPPSAPPQGPAESAAGSRLFYAQGVWALLAGDPHSARSAFAAALLLDPHSAWLEYSLARVFVELEEPEFARRNVEQALRDDPELVEAWLLSGKLSLERGSPVEAEACYRRAIELGDVDLAYEGLVKSLAQQGRDKDAQREALVWAEQEHTDPFVCFKRGALRFTIGDKSGAQDDIGRFLEQAPADIALRDFYLDFYVDVVRSGRRFRAALVLLDQLATFEPGNKTLGLTLAQLAEDRGDLTRAIRAWRRLDALVGGQDPYLRFKLADALADAGRWEEVRELLENTQATAAELPTLVELRARATWKSGDPRAALQILRLAPDPESMSSTLLMVEILLSLGQKREARSLLESSLQPGAAYRPLARRLAELDLQEGHIDKALARVDAMSDLSEPGRLLEKAGLLEDARKMDQAISILGQGAERFPGDPRLKVEHLRLLIHAGRLAEADVLARRELEKDPASVHILALLGFVQIEQEDFQGAIKSYRRALASVAASEEESAGLANDLAYALAQANQDLDEASTLARAAVEDRPGSASYLDTLGWVLHRQGKSEQALAFVEEALALEPEHTEILDHQATILQSLGRQVEARRIRARVVEIQRRARKGNSSP